MKAHGLNTYRVDAPDKECGDWITHPVVPGGKFEKLIAKKGESFAFSWTICSDEEHVVAGAVELSRSASPTFRSCSPAGQRSWPSRRGT